MSAVTLKTVMRLFALYMITAIILNVACYNSIAIRNLLLW